MGSDILLDPTILSSSLEDFAQSVYFNVTTFTGRKDVLVGVVVGSVTIVPLDCTHTRFIEVKTATFINLLLKNRNPICSVCVIGVVASYTSIWIEDIRAFQLQQLISSQSKVDTKNKSQQILPISIGP